ncbi:MAG TPA: hypothetical protein VN920_15800 [Pyrinomonadaceae bacterium]|nr:hypothetical protein [Pyrinomonadaceae bacterium]
MRKSFWVVLVVILASTAFVSAASLGPEQPRMQAALADLEAAKSELQRAEHNKGGHRGKAIAFVNAAIAEVNRGIAFDRRHNHAQSMSNLFAEATLAPDQPHMKAALNQLNNAKKNLEAATADKGGHRVKALGFVNKALDEIALGLEAGR